MDLFLRHKRDKALRGSALCANDEDINALLALFLVDRYVGGKFTQAALEKILL